MLSFPRGKLNNITAASKNMLSYNRGSVRFKSGTPLIYRLPFLRSGGENLSNYNMYVYLDESGKQLNMRISPIATPIYKFLNKIKLKKMTKSISFDTSVGQNHAFRQIKEFISTDEINKFMNTLSVRKTALTKLMSFIIP